MSDSPASTQLLVREGQSLRLRSRHIGVEVVAGPDADSTRELPGPEVRIGTSRDCDVVLTDPTVSRVHVSLNVDSIGLRVVDVGSRNATILDGVRIREAYARPDSILELGSTKLRLKLSTAMVDVPLSSKTHLGALIGGSSSMRRLFSLIEQVAPTDSTVLIEGETGSGKELVAEALHELGPRADAPFVVFDCSAVSPSLIESELFGHIKGAYTGAVADRAGAFESADGGTLFIDEIGELPISLQPKLLRALEAREIRRVGGDKTRKVDVRIIAATNRTLLAETEAGRFREDLYYRLAVVRASVPPLRERVDDIPMLVEHFHRQWVERGQTTRALPPGLSAQLQTQAWPGNVRELRNAVESALALGPLAPAPASSSPSAAVGAIDFSVPLSEAIERFERAFISEALRQCDGNVSHAAELAGTNRKFVQRAIKRYHLRESP